MRKKRANRRFKRRIAKPAKSLLGFPKEQVVRMRYSDWYAANAGTSGTVNYNYRANSVYHPDATGTGHQPSAFDLWSQFYDHYVVIGSKITVTFNCATSSATSAPTIVGLLLNDDTTLTPTVPLAVIENRLGSYATFVPNSINKKTLRLTFSPKKFFGIKDIKDNIGRLGAQVTANPTDEAYFTIYVGALVPGENPDAVNGLITIDYLVKFSEPKDLPQSTV